MKRDDDDDDDVKDVGEDEMSGWMYSATILLRKYGSHLLLAGSLVLLGYVGWQRYKDSQAAKMDESWVKLFEAQGKIDQAARGETAENPANALRDAANSSDVPAVRQMAFLWLGDYYLKAINLGHYGQVEKVDIDEALRQAQGAYEKVVSESKELSPMVLSARMGLGKVAEDKHEWSTAADYYKAIVTDATTIGYPELAKIAAGNLNALDDRKLAIALAPAPPATTQPELPSLMPGSDMLMPH